MIEHGIEFYAHRTSEDMRRVDRLEEALKYRGKLMSVVRRHLKMNPKPHVNRIRLPSINDRFNHNTRFQKKPTFRFVTDGRNATAAVSTPENPFSPELINPMKALLEKLASKRPYGKILTAPCVLKAACDRDCFCQQTLKCNVRKSTNKENTINNDQQHKSAGCKVNRIVSRLQVADDQLPPSRIDYEPDYFISVNGRPLQEHFKCSEFKRSQRGVIFKSLINGYHRDETLRRQEQHELDLCLLEGTDNEMDKVKRSFEKFMQEGHEESVSLVKQRITIEQIREIVAKNVRDCRGMLSELKSTIHRIDHKLGELLLCRDLILNLSPLCFRQEYAAEVRRHKTKQKISDDLIKLYDDYCRYNPEHGEDNFLDEAMTAFVDEIATLGPPMIYFREGWELDVVLRRMELDCVRQFSDLSRIQRRNQELDTLRAELNKYTAWKLNTAGTAVKANTEHIDSLHERAETLGEATNLELETFYKQLFTGDLVLEMMALIEILHQDIFGPSKKKSEPVDMMSDIEKELIRVDENVKALGDEVFKHYEKTCNDNEARLLTNPIRAKKKLNEIRGYIKRANTMHSRPLVGRFWKIPLLRSAPPPMLRRPVKHRSEHLAAKTNHLQLNGIVDRDDLEEDLGKLIHIFNCDVHLPTKGHMRSSISDRSSLISAVTSKSLSDALESKPTSMASAKSASFIFLDVDYDSEEQLIQNNVEERRNRGIAVEESPVMYDMKKTDDTFMVSNAEQITPKDRRHKHRISLPQKINSLSWR